MKYPTLPFMLNNLPETLANGSLIAPIGYVGVGCFALTGKIGPGLAAITKPIKLALTRRANRMSIKDCWSAKNETQSSDCVALDIGVF